MKRFNYLGTELAIAAAYLMINVLLLADINLADNEPTSFNANESVEKQQASNNALLYASQHNHNYNYTDNIPVNIQVKPAFYLHGKIYIATGVNFKAKAEVVDEKYKNATIEYQWSVKNKTITTRSNASEIVYKFDQADSDNFLEVLVFHRPNDTGTCNKSFVIRDPIVLAEPVGKFFLEHGQLLDITLKFTGTGPSQYCQDFCLLDGPKSDCKQCSPNITTKFNEINIVKYLHSVGNYTLDLVIDNVASHASKSYSVRITESIRPKTVPYIPIVSSILAVIVLLSGVALHLKCRKSITAETADFDFIRHDYNDEDLWEQSFVQRVKYLWFQADRDHGGSMNDSNLNVTTRARHS